MKPNPKIIIFYASYGYGHLQVSRALLSYFQDFGINNVKLIDLLSIAHPIFDAMSRYIYSKSTSYLPKLYGWSYYLTYNMHHDQWLAKWLNSLCIQKLAEIVDLEKPDAIIHTFPMLTISELRVKNQVYIPTFTVLTDYVLHSRWIHPGTDKYFVATEDLKIKLIKKGILKDQIKVSGIPIRKIFQENFDVPEILQSYNLESGKKNVLIMAGSYGGISILKKMILLLLSLEDVQIIIICGRNKRLQTTIEALFKQVSRICILGFVEQIQELMAISSCIITKAGGITLSETIALQLPTIVFRPVPGQEKENASYLADKKLIYITQSLSELKNVALQLLTKTGEINRMKQSLSSSQKLAAAEIVVSDILQEIEQQQGEIRNSNEN
jgi:processive 1,2-diacylglycerol beta-glucosyltransferase